MTRLLPAAVLLCLFLARPAFPQDEEPSLKPGLVATYADGQQKVALLAPSPSFALSAGHSIHPQIGPKFTAEWTGFLQILRAGTYTITGDARVSVDGNEIQGKPVALKAGDHPVLIRYTRAKDEARLLLTWQSDHFKAEPMPAKAFGHRDVPPEVAAQVKVERGRALAEERSCGACHAGAPASLGARRGPDLSHVGSRAGAPWIFHWLADPKRFRPQALMPAMIETDPERADAAAYLAGLRDPKEKKEEEKKEATFDAARVLRGRELFETIGCAACHGKGGLTLEGLGSKGRASGLAAYLFDPLAVDPGGRMPSLGLTEKEAASLAEHLVQSKNPAFEADAAAGGSASLAAGDAARGKALVASRGCLACHALQDGGAALGNAFKAPAWSALAAGASKGCLADAPSGGAPRFGFSPAEREDLRAYLGARDASEASVHAFQRAIAKFRCTACHALEDRGPSDLAEPPPPLTGAGFKLRPSWIKAVLTERKRIRPWMSLRMPQFGAANVGPLVPLFAAAVGGEPGEGHVTGTPTLDQIKQGIRLIGKAEGGLGCVNCHDFNGHVSSGTRGPDMVEMTERLRPEWFRRWLRNPGRIQPGTAMPEFFSSMPEAEAEKNIAVLWACLAAGKDLPLPSGLTDTQNFVLQVKGEPIVFRTFMPNASPRSIAVGLTPLLSYCFDAEQSRLRYAWIGGFLDVKPVWTDRGGAPAIPQGKRFYTAPDAYPLRIGDPGREPVRKFRGYAIVDKIPEFMYELDGVEVRERVTAPPGAAAKAGLVRTFTLPSVKDPVWFLTGQSDPAAGGVVWTASAGQWEGGRLKVPGGGSVQFTVTLRVDEK